MGECERVGDPYSAIVRELESEGVGELNVVRLIRKGESNIERARKRKRRRSKQCECERVRE